MLWNDIILIKFFFFTELQRDMKNNFFGQHIATKIVLSALKGHVNRTGNSKKPLVMSFHGWTGSGKNFISDLIASHMFKTEKIKKLRYRVINGQSDFEFQSKAQEYRVGIYLRMLGKNVLFQLDLSFINKIQ